MNTIAIDFETFYSTHYSIQDLGNWAYTHHENFDPYMVSVWDGVDGWAGHPKDFNWNALAGARLISHNQAFDQAVLHAAVEKKLFPKVALDYADWKCSANMSAYLCNRRSLKDASAFLLGEKTDKGIRDWMKGHTWNDAVAMDKSKELTTYALEDSRKCWTLWDRFSSKWPHQEQMLSDHGIYRGAKGVMIDVDLLKTYKSWLEIAMEENEQKLPWVQRGGKPTSPKGIAEQCIIEGIPCPPVKTHDEEGFELWESTWRNKYEWVKGVSNHRTINKVLGLLDTMLLRLRPDGTIESPLKYWGAHTGRWSGTSGINFQNFRNHPLILTENYALVPDDSEEFDAIEKLWLKGEAPAGYKFIDVRRLIVARPGKIFALSDLSQIEPRVLAWLAGDFAKLKLIESGISVYEAEARATGGWSGSDKMRDRDPALYKAYKARVLGLGYQCGSDKYKVVAKTLAGLDLEPEQCVKEVAAFRASNPKIVGLWQRFDDTFKKSAGDDFTVELPSGRSLVYRNVKREFRVKKNKDSGRPEKEIQFAAETDGRRHFFYGGKLAENATQAVARDVFSECVLNLEFAGIEVPFHVHDEADTEIDLDNAKDAKGEIENIMSRPIPWLPGCPIGAECKLSPHFTK